MIRKHALRQSRIVRVLAPVLAGTLMSLLTAGTAVAAPPASSHPSGPAAAAVSCSTNPKQGGTKEKVSDPVVRGDSVQSFFKTHVELWWSPTCRTVWAVLVGGQTAPDGTADRFWVYNVNTMVESLAKDPATETGAIDDANTMSHACMQNPDAGEFNMPKTCTGDF